MTDIQEKIHNFFSTMDIYKISKLGNVITELSDTWIDMMFIFWKFGLTPR